MTSASDSFYVTLSSDKGVSKSKAFQDSDFTVPLSQEIRLEMDRWEVGLASFTYPYAFNTVGHNNLILLRYREFIHEITIPVWNCPSITQLAEYLDVEMNKKVLYGKRSLNEKKRPVRVEVDTYKRIRFSFDTEDVDLGFAEHTIDMLGFKTQEELTLSNFKKRQRIRGLVKSMLKKGDSFDLNLLEALKQRLVEEPDFVFKDNFFETFLFTITKKFEYPNSGVGPKQAMFQKLTEGVKNPFNKNIENEVEGVGGSLDSKKPFNFTIHFEKTKNEIVEPLGEKLENQSHIHHLDWFRKTAYQDLFSYKELEDFITSFEAILDVEKRTSYDSSNNTIQYSGLYTEAVASFICAKFLKDFKLSSASLFSEEPAVLNPYELMYIYLDIIKPEPFNFMLSPLLEIIRTEGEPGSITQYRSQGHLQYKSLVVSTMSQIRILIASRYGQPVPFLRGPSELQLHFKRKERRHFN